MENDMSFLVEEDEQTMKEKIFSVYQKSNAEKVLHAWKKYSRNIIPTPRSIESKVFIEKKNGKYRSQIFVDLVVAALSAHTIEEIVESIKNYFEILLSQKYYYDYIYKSIGQFLYQGIKNKSGFYNFLPSQNPHERYEVEFETDIYFHARKIFFPITEENVIKGLDKATNRYYGFDIDTLEQVSSRYFDVERYIDTGTLLDDLSNFWELELCIAGLLWQRKINPQSAFLKKFIMTWESEKDNFDLESWGNN